MTAGLNKDRIDWKMGMVDTMSSYLAEKASEGLKTNNTYDKALVKNFTSYTVSNLMNNALGRDQQFDLNQACYVNTFEAALQTLKTPWNEQDGKSKNPAESARNMDTAEAMLFGIYDGLKNSATSMFSDVMGVAKGVSDFGQKTFNLATGDGFRTNREVEAVTAALAELDRQNQQEKDIKDSEKMWQDGSMDKIIAIRSGDLKNADYQFGADGEVAFSRVMSLARTQLDNGNTMVIAPREDGGFDYVEYNERGDKVKEFSHTQAELQKKEQETIQNFYGETREKTDSRISELKGLGYDTSALEQDVALRRQALEYNAALAAQNAAMNPGEVRVQSAPSFGEAFAWAMRAENPFFSLMESSAINKPLGTMMYEPSGKYSPIPAANVYDVAGPVYAIENNRANQTDSWQPLDGNLQPHWGGKNFANCFDFASPSGAVFGPQKDDFSVLYAGTAEGAGGFIRIQLSDDRIIEIAHLTEINNDLIQAQWEKRTTFQQVLTWEVLLVQLGIRVERMVMYRVLLRGMGRSYLLQAAMKY